jgi:hypothetical protein
LFFGDSGILFSDVMTIDVTPDEGPIPTRQGVTRMKDL